MKRFCLNCNIELTKGCGASAAALLSSCSLAFFILLLVLRPAESYNVAMLILHGGKHEMDFQYCKLEIFIPETHLPALQKTLQAVDAGHIGNYDCCLSYSGVTSCWRPLEGTKPYHGTVGEISSEPELKVGVTCRIEQVNTVIEAVKRIHPYEEPVINAIPLYRTSF